MNQRQPSFELFMMRGPSMGAIFPLADKNLTIGRDPISDIAISDPEVSRQHALLISAHGGVYHIQDLGSTNGTYIDGVRLGSRPETLRPFNAITMGSSVTLIFRERSEDAEVELDGAGENPPTAGDVKTQDATAGEPVPISAARDESRSAPLPVRELPQQSPRTEAKRPELQDVGQPPAYSNAHSEREVSGDLSPNLILGLVLLLLCSCATVLVFLVYLRGDWLLRQIGLVP